MRMTENDTIDRSVFLRPISATCRGAIAVNQQDESRHHMRQAGRISAGRESGQRQHSGPWPLRTSPETAGTIRHTTAGRRSERI